jgi:hypothetical protein
MPGRNILSLLRDDTGSVGELATIPKPTITGGDDPREKKLAPSEGDAQASLTIVLRSSK